MVDCFGNSNVMQIIYSGTSIIQHSLEHENCVGLTKYDYSGEISMEIITKGVMEYN